jgi:hypothetical protein
MHGPAQRLIKSRGTEYTVRNASGGGGRSSPDYSEDGTLTGVLERRTRPTVETLSSGETVESELEIRAVDVAPTIVGQGGSDYPSKLVHPDGQTFEVVTSHPEDSGVTVLTVVRD